VAFHLLLLKWHPMIGCDIHLELTATWPPVPAPNTPHLVAQRLAGFGGATMTDDDVLANNWNIIQRDSDIQYGIPHIPIPPYPPCALALLWTGLSGSKSYFGPRSVVSSKGPIAAALLVYVNPQLNCDDPLPLPTGIAITWSTVVCGMTWGDIIGGFLSMAFDMLISWLLNKLGERLAAKLLPKGLAKWVAKALETTINTILQQITGSPVGYTWSLPGHGLGDPYNPGNWGPMLGHPLGEWIGRATGLDSPAPAPPAPTNNFANDPAVEQL
jgi:hypothetical protein